MSEHAGLIPIGQAARLLMISEERIRQLVKQGFIPKPEKRGFVQLVGAVQGYPFVAAQHTTAVTLLTGAGYGTTVSPAAVVNGSYFSLLSGLFS